MERYVDKFTSPQPLLFWHEGDKIGDIVYDKMFGSFLVEIAKELPDKQSNLSDDMKPFMVSCKAVWDAIEGNDTPFGASIGFRYKAGDEVDNAYDKIEKFETSVLPVESAANAVTMAHVMITKE